MWGAIVRFVFTLNLPSRQNNLVQEIIGEYEATSLTEIYAHIHRGQRFLLITTYYQNGDKWVEREKMLINVSMVGRIKLFKENDRDR